MTGTARAICRQLAIPAPTGARWPGRPSADRRG